jgi:hypothetical protein
MWMKCHYLCMCFFPVKITSVIVQNAESLFVHYAPLRLDVTSYFVTLYITFKTR